MSTKSSLLPEDRNFLEGILGADTVAKLENDAELRGKILESAGVKFKSAEGEEPPTETTLMIAATAKLFTDVQESIKASAEAIKASASVVEAADLRLAEIESKLERQSIMLMSLIAPQAASKSIFTQLTPEEAAQLAKLQKTDDNQKPPEHKKSLLEQLAEQAGAAPILGT